MRVLIFAAILLLLGTATAINWRSPTRQPRDLTRADVVCEAPNRAHIKAGLYRRVDIAHIFEWCDMRPEVTFSGTPAQEGK